MKDKLIQEKLPIIALNYEKQVMFDLDFDLKIEYNNDESDTKRSDYDIYFIKDADDKRMLHYMIFSPAEPEKVYFNFFQFEDSSMTNEDFNYRQLILMAIDKNQLRRKDREILVRATEFSLDFEKGIWNIKNDMDF